MSNYLLCRKSDIRANIRIWMNNLYFLNKFIFLRIDCNVNNFWTLACNFLATLVALPSTPVSQSVSRTNGVSNEHNFEACKPVCSLELCNGGVLCCCNNWYCPSAVQLSEKGRDLKLQLIWLLSTSPILILTQFTLAQNATSPQPTRSLPSLTNLQNCFSAFRIKAIACSPLFCRHSG